MLWRESKGAEPVAVGACTFLVHADAEVVELLLLATRRGHGRRGLGAFLVNAVNRQAASEFGVTVSATPAAADAEGFWAKQVRGNNNNMRIKIIIHGALGEVLGGTLSVIPECPACAKRGRATLVTWRSNPPRGRCLPTHSTGRECCIEDWAEICEM